MDGFAPETAGNAAQALSPAPDDDVMVYLVPYRWWREAQESDSDEGGGCGAKGGGVRGIPYTASPGASSYGMKIITNIFSSDLVFNLRKDDDSVQNGDSEDGPGVSGRTHALIPSYLWTQALRWHNAAAAAAASASRAADADGSFFSEDGW